MRQGLLRRQRTREEAMAITIIVSYDGTDNDQDALALGRLFGEAGASLALAYVRHAKESQERREELAQQDAERLLESGAERLGQPDVPRYVVLSASTSEGLRALTQQQGADVIVFGSDYRTAPGHVAPGTSAQQLLEDGPAAVAIAPAGLRDRVPLRIETLAAVEEGDDPSASQTAEALAGRLGATVEGRPAHEVDLLVISSHTDAPAGRVSISGAAGYLIETVGCPVLVVPRGTPVRFDAPA
jgi:nucleotide-binding universal stress UspA family protein